MQDDFKYLSDLEAEVEKLRRRIGELEHLSSEPADAKGDLQIIRWRGDPILHSSPNGVALYEFDGRILDANPAYCKMLAYSLDELKRMKISDIEAKESPEETVRHIDAIRRSGGDYFETKLRRKDGKIIDVEVSSNIYEFSGRQCIIALQCDITARKQAEQALLENEEKYKTLVEMSPHAIMIAQDGKVAFANRMAIRKYIGEKAEDIVGRDAYSVVPDYEKERLRDYSKRRYEGDKTVPVRYRADLLRADGLVSPAEIYSHRIIFRGKPAIQVMAIDISDQEEAARALKESENKFRTLVEQINAVTYTALPDQISSCVYISPQIETLTGFSVDEMTRDPGLWLKRIHPDDLQRVEREMSECHATGRPASIEYRMIAKDGRIVWFQDEAIIKCDDAGRPMAVHGVMVDITRLKEAEATLSASEKRYQELFNSALEGISIIDTDRIVRFCNPSFAKLFDLNGPEEIIGRSTFEFMDEDQQQIVMRQIGLRRKKLSTQYEIEITTAKNIKKTILVSSSPLFDSEDEYSGTLSASIDITERRELEKIHSAMTAISEAVGITGNLEELIAKIRNSIESLINVTNFYVALWDQENNIYTFPFLVDTDGTGPFPPTRLKNTLTDYVRKTGRPLLANAEVQEKLRRSGDFKLDFKPPASWLGVPLRAAERVIGVVAVQIYDSPSFFTENDLRVLSMVSGHIGMAIERKRAEEALRESERRFHDLFENFTSGYILAKIITDKAGKPVDYIYLEVNKAFEEMTGKSAAEVKGKKVTEVFPIINKTRLIEQCGRVALTGEPLRLEYVSLVMGRLIETLVFSTRYGEFATVFNDVTEKRKADNALRQSEERHRAIWENSPVGICLIDRDGVYHYVNRTYCNIYGYTPEELIGKPFYEMISPPELRLIHSDEYKRKFGNNKSNEISEAEVFVTKNGEPVAIQYTNDYVMEDGRAIYEVTMNIDVTEKKRAEDALRESEAKYRLLIENAGEIIVTLDRNGTFLHANRSAAKYFGLSPAELVGKSLRDLFPPEVVENHMANIKQVFITGEDLSIETMVIINGERMWFRANLQPIVDNYGRTSSALVIARDITAKKQAEIRNQARLHLLQRLRQAHNINECLKLGCQAILEAGLFKRAVLTLHNEAREITNLGQIGLDDEVVAAARQGAAPDQELVRKMLHESHRISQSFFVPVESEIIDGLHSRYIPQDENGLPQKGMWQPGDELFVPVLGNDDNYEGWLSVDTPLDGKRPSRGVVMYLEEIVDITSKQVHEIQSLEWLRRESQALQEKNITLREVLAAIEDDKMEIRQRIGNNVSEILMPAFNKLIKKDGTINRTYYNILKAGLPELVTTSGAVVHLYARLSPREREICNMIKSGSTSKEIAASLNISLATVQKHRELIRRKLGIVNKNINLVNYLKGI